MKTLMISLGLGALVGVGVYYASVPSHPVVEHQLIPHHKLLVLEGRDEANSAVLDENGHRVSEQEEQEP
jgi:hypothetical protein